MPNSNHTLIVINPTHGRFDVDADHANRTADAHSGWTLDALHSKIETLVGVGNFDYTDLTYIEAVIVLSYLTGGAR